MNPSDLDTLIHACLDGRATDDEMARLEACLAADPAARDRYLRLVDLHACLAIDEALWREPAGAGRDAGPQVTARSMRKMSFRVPFAAAACGLLVGLCGAGLAFGYVVPMLTRPLVIFADGFESGPAPECRGFVGRPGIWSGDESQVVRADQGVVPAEGRRMLRLLRADYPGKSGTDSYVADTFRVIDLRPYRSLLAGGHVIGRVSAHFTTADYPVGEAYDSTVCVYAFDSSTVRLDEIADVDFSSVALAMTQRRSTALDRHSDTWQQVDAELRLPANTDFLIIRFSVAHGPGEQRGVTFAGHYMDDVVASLEESPVRMHR